MPACVLALEATLVVESVDGRREIAAGDYFKGLYETERRANELLIEVRVPEEKPGTVSVFMELARRHGDFAIAGLACHARFDGEVVADARLVYFASEDRPRLGARAMAAIIGEKWSETTREAAFAALADDLDPMADLQGGPKMKLHLQRVLTGRALDAALAKAAA
jgi:carbon-monoxide dehydrogenase medium subunit